LLPPTVGEQKTDLKTQIENANFFFNRTQNPL